ncbi:MAG: hypothetical protein H6R48_216 [Proteobacteria bacterium]|nr:hypothetical protein [Pseudomonadota bacterium]
MKLMKSLLAWSVLLGLLTIAGRVVAADGWLAGGVFLIGAVLLLALFGALFDLLSRLFRHRSGG